MAQKKIIGDLNVQGAIKHNGQEISYSGGSDFKIDDINAGCSGGYLEMTFPQGIIPLCYHFSGTNRKYYFDYPNEVVLNASGNPVADSTVASDDAGSGVYVQIPQDLEDEILDYDKCIYIKTAVGEESGVMIMQWPVGNTYKMLYPSDNGGGESKPSYVGYKFKNEIHSPDQINIVFTVDEDPDAAQYTPDDPHEEESNDSHRVITRIGYVNGVPALFNPDPEDGGCDCWYIYSGTMEVGGTVYDKWWAPDPNNSLDGGHWYRLSNRVVDDPSVEDVKGLKPYNVPLFDDDEWQGDGCSWKFTGVQQNQPFVMIYIKGFYATIDWKKPAHTSGGGYPIPEEYGNTGISGNLVARAILNNNGKWKIDTNYLEMSIESEYDEGTSAILGIMFQGDPDEYTDFDWPMTFENLDVRLISYGDEYNWAFSFEEWGFEEIHII